MAQLRSSPPVLASFPEITTDLCSNWSGVWRCSKLSFFIHINYFYYMKAFEERLPESLWRYSEVYDSLPHDKKRQRRSTFTHLLTMCTADSIDYSRNLRVVSVWFVQYIIWWLNNCKPTRCLVLFRKCWLANMARLTKMVNLENISIVTVSILMLAFSSMCCCANYSFTAAATWQQSG